jgi:WD40-like Beta Propeller Repeat
VSSRDGRYTATVVSSKARETIVVVDHRLHTRRSVFAHFTDPIVLLNVSDDGRWVFFQIDPDGSGSIAADGLILRVVSSQGGDARELGVALPYPDYLTWCAGALVWIGGADRVAIHAKRLLVASPPDWRPKPLWYDTSRSFASPACAPDGRSVAVLSQRSSNDANFFHTRWRLWQVGLDGAHRVLDVPPRPVADEQPIWSRDGHSILFVRERYGHGSVMLWHAGRISGPLASLGYGLGYYGHHGWQLDWSAAA